MPNVSDNLFQAIDEIVESKTFSLDGLTAIQKIKDQAQALDAENKGLRSLHHHEENRANKAVEDLKKLQDEHGRILVKLADIEKREAAVQKLELTAQFAELRRQDLFTLVQTVFKSPSFKKEVNSYGSVPKPGDTYGGTVSVSSGSTEKISEE